MSRVACETSITTGLVLVMGEITTQAYIDIPQIVRETLRNIGYTRGNMDLMLIPVELLHVLMSSLRILHRG